jgi:hypothetical protein
MSKEENDNDWKTVPYKKNPNSKQKAYKTKPSSASTVKYTDDLNMNDSESLAIDEEVVSNIHSFIKLKADQLNLSNYTRFMNSQFEEALPDTLIKSISILGIGSFTSTKLTEYKQFTNSNSFWQLLLGLCLIGRSTQNKRNLEDGDETKAEQHSNISASCYDPLLANEKDRLIFGPLPIELKQINHKGIFDPVELYNVNDLQPNERILLFMPHCPYRLYCNILFSFWNCLDKLVIVGNRLVKWYFVCYLFLSEFPFLVSKLIR